MVAARSTAVSLALKGLRSRGSSWLAVLVSLGLGYRSGAIYKPRAMETMDPVLVLCAHPHLEHSTVNRALKAAAMSTPGVQLRDLYALYPDYSIDVAAEQAALHTARLVVWLHPVHWYGMTPLLKLWVDEVLAYGWAYGHEGRALQGKDLWLVASTGGDEASYRPDGHNRHFFDAFLPPYEQTAALCGMRFLPPLVLHGAHRVGDPTLSEHVQLFAQRLQSHPQWPELDDLHDGVDCEVAPDQRPQTVEAT